jgi:glycosyltransferase involved in cell wall biosynthesis
MTLVSICIPTYNRPCDLRRAIESCLAQTYSNFEIMITDSTDA